MNDDMQFSTDVEQVDEEYKDRLCTDLTRTEQRSLIFHLLYALDASSYDTSLEAIADNFYKGFAIEIPLDSDVFKNGQAISSNREELDALIIPLIENWRFDRLGIITRLILRLAVWELKYTQTDSAVVINEAIELAKCFAEKDAYKFINGVLDEYVKRTSEE